MWPLRLLHTLLSAPPGSCQSRLMLTLRSGWCRVDFLVLFLTIFGFIGSEGSHGAEEELAATSVGSAEEELRSFLMPLFLKRGAPSSSSRKSS